MFILGGPMFSPRGPGPDGFRPPGPEGFRPPPGPGFRLDSVRPPGQFPRGGPPPEGMMVSPGIDRHPEGFGREPRDSRPEAFESEREEFDCRHERPEGSQGPRPESFDKRLPHPDDFEGFGSRGPPHPEDFDIHPPIPDDFNPRGIHPDDFDPRGRRPPDGYDPRGPPREGFDSRMPHPEDFDPRGPPRPDGFDRRGRGPGPEFFPPRREFGPRGMMGPRMGMGPDGFGPRHLLGRGPGECLPFVFRCVAHFSEAHFHMLDRSIAGEICRSPQNKSHGTATCFSFLYHAPSYLTCKERTTDPLNRLGRPHIRCQCFGE